MISGTTRSWIRIRKDSSELVSGLLTHFDMLALVEKPIDLVHESLLVVFETQADQLVLYHFWLNSCQGLGYSLYMFISEK